ncbi:ABC transporter permease [Staphylococcus sp. IVB6214]|uniref:ABC transporter permease n=1 Tax=Staphylococcus sp. IVB6214 TaxID=2989766 RepID=UPI0021CFA2A6|nr:ABC transporter permease [Staphylococcus sp. IVB6214]UXR82405.1 ABC transporter permease [Staphylococcus sp. IVB6214]
MNNLMKAELFKLPKIHFVIAIVMAVMIAEILAFVLYMYNMHFSNIEDSSLHYLIYGVTWFTPVFYLLYGMFSSKVISTEYENNMWSVLLVSQKSKNAIICVKWMILFILMFLTTIIFMLLHTITSIFVTDDSPQFIPLLYIMMAFFIGTLAMQSIQFFIALIIENRVYVMALGILFALLSLLMSSNTMPFKIPEHIINAKYILDHQQLMFFDTSFFVYGGYSLIIFVLILVVSSVYIKRKEF